MHRFTNILFCPLADKGNKVAVRRVIDLAARNDAKVTMLGAIAEPSLLQRVMHRDHYIDTIQAAERKAVLTKLTRCAPKASDGSIERRIVIGSQAISIIEQVLVAEHDLVVVTSDEDDEDQSTIKRLLRKCPCPVWVIRPTRARIQRVLAAVNPDPSESGVNRTILELASSMSLLYGGELHVVHAWELYGEATMRSSSFMHTPATEVEALLTAERSSHRDALNTLLANSGVEEHPWKVHLRKGPPGEIVPEVATKQRINLLVLGTVARTGVAGLIMGNTAETVLDNVRCSVIALKPPGFVSPVALPAT